ncbi:sulfur carrier protein ThiS [Paenibacillus mucilaginosus]|uniref:Thiamine biosynthesis protein ThiS n=3 Tax=Paenibacillus mucilaginosus TaxID=61624 RepID=H6NBR8_9BACL|nr:sulfur carrier protein ThiS [Paenibacillus mucilaginosus]AEI39626.1 thiamine biosynthesis protein ThiS [Paenibacillus mucilaginosus KNP414]AFC27869.1 thiamine biosynthesis protein ThiS [Paenibacillus mucilaginosus 3016]AFH60023.1 sulfur carrier protein ThiS [Paenibacillus mucilaginosus K02]MCG7218001.1 sulfur carrier protein ThiS [Paenibacillus mucilaginosus]WDM28569.1 sulfur carrier protein ThiS [Paenibacillus mucilaginosus]
MNLIVNGESREVEGAATVAELLSVFKLQNKILVVELNREIVDRSRYEDARLNDGDRIEIVHFVGGG